MRRRGLALCAALLLLCLLPGSALALATVDQKNESWNNSVDLSASMAQTFKAGRTGSMTGADLRIYRTIGTTTVTLSIQKLGWMGYPDGTPLVSTTGVVGTADTWVHFSFQSLGVTAGQSYAIVFTTGSICYVRESTANPYPDGRAVYSPHGAWANLLNSPNQDLAFRTWMNLPPQLMTLLPTATPPATPTAAATAAPDSTSSLAPGATPTPTATPAPSDSPASTDPLSTEPIAAGASATETSVATATPALVPDPGAGSSSSSAAPIVAAAIVVTAGLAGGLLLMLVRRRRAVARE